MYEEESERHGKWIYNGGIYFINRWEHEVDFAGKYLT